jgi:hypothetical protein
MEVKMRHKEIKSCVVLLLGLSLTGLHAQEAIPASGGNNSGSGGSVTYTVGQVLYITNIAADGSVAHGVQQPYEISVVSGLEEKRGIDLIFSAYPNPAVDFLILKVENYNNNKLSYELYDLSGKILENGKITGNKTSISFGNLNSEIYFLKLIENNKEIKVFKIIKNQ